MIDQSFGATAMTKSIIALMTLWMILLSTPARSVECPDKLEPSKRASFWAIFATGTKTLGEHPIRRVYRLVLHNECPVIVHDVTIPHSSCGRNDVAILKEGDRYLYDGKHISFLRGERRYEAKGELFWHEGGIYGVRATIPYSELTTHPSPDGDAFVYLMLSGSGTFRVQKDYYIEAFDMRKPPPGGVDCAGHLPDKRLEPRGTPPARILQTNTSGGAEPPPNKN